MMFSRLVVHPITIRSTIVVGIICACMSEYVVKMEQMKGNEEDA